MAEVVVNGVHLPLRKMAAAELIRRAGELLPEQDGALLATPAMQMSLSLDAMEPAAAARVARAVVECVDGMRGEIRVLDASADEVEMAAQLTAVSMLVGRAYAA